MRKKLAVVLVAGIAALFVAHAARAEVVTNMSVPITLATFVPCANGGAGELVVLSGNLQLVDAITFDQSGGAHIVTHANPQAVSGTGSTTGTTYHGTGATVSTENVGVGVQSVFVNNFRIVAANGASLQVHENIVLVVNANGTVTATVDNSSVTCG